MSPDGSLVLAGGSLVSVLFLLGGSLASANHALHYSLHIDDPSCGAQASLMHLLPADIKVGVRCQASRPKGRDSGIPMINIQAGRSGKIAKSC